MIRKVYIRAREGIPDGSNCYAAYEGFRRLGVETAWFEGFGDVEQIGDLGPEVGLIGYVGDYFSALDRAGVERPDPIDYPRRQQRFLRRRVERSTLGGVRSSSSRIFVKSVEHKVFSGFVWTGSRDDRLRVATHGDDVEVWVSDVVTFAGEHRCFFLDGKVVDVRPYKGDWSAFPDPKVVRALEESFDREGTHLVMGDKVVRAPAAFSADVGVTNYGATLLVEVNDGFALGSYGLNSVLYARMVSARWEELVRK